jgi:hypothetical protein
VPSSPAPRDRFDDLPVDGSGRIGAHRAENPRMRGGIVVLWSAVAVLVLAALGIFGTMIATGRITLFPSPTPTTTAVATVAPQLDTTYQVVVLNATDQAGLAGAVRDQLLAAGWTEAAVTAGNAGETDFETTTVYYPIEADESAARGLADLIGAPRVALDASYPQPVDDPDTADVDESLAKQLVVVIGLDKTDAAATSPAT